MIVHRAIFLVALIYAIYKFGDDAIFLLKLGQVWLDAFLVNPTGTLQYIFSR